MFWLQRKHASLLPYTVMIHKWISTVIIMVLIHDRTVALRHQNM